MTCNTHASTIVHMAPGTRTRRTHPNTRSDGTTVNHARTRNQRNAEHNDNAPNSSRTQQSTSATTVAPPVSSHRHSPATTPVTATRPTNEIATQPRHMRRQLWHRTYHKRVRNQRKDTQQHPRHRQHHASNHMSLPRRHHRDHATHAHPRFAIGGVAHPHTCPPGNPNMLSALCGPRPHHARLPARVASGRKPRAIVRAHRILGHGYCRIAGAAHAMHYSGQVP